MILIHPDGKTETKPYSYDALSAAINIGSNGDHPFTVVPLPDGYDSGYAVFVNDNGIALGLERNPVAEKLTGYHALYGVAVVASNEEAEETDLLVYTKKRNRDAFEKKLAVLTCRSN